MKSIKEQFREAMGRLQGATPLLTPPGGYVAVKAEFTKGDGTVYVTTWRHGVGRCTCLGFRYRRTCRHVSALVQALKHEKKTRSKKKNAIGDGSTAGGPTEQSL